MLHTKRNAVEIFKQSWCYFSR